MKHADSIALFAAVAEHCRLPWTYSESAKFGANALRVHDKIFAALTRSGHLLLKLPPARVATLLAERRATRFSSGGRTMTGWIILAPEDRQSWIALADEAHAFGAAEIEAKPRRRKA